MTTGGYTSEQLRVEATSLEFTAFALADAIDLGQRAATLAMARALPVVIEIRLGNRVVFRAALPGTTADNDDWLRRKANVVARYETSTLAARVGYEERGLSFTEATGLPASDFAPHGGGWPIVVRGVGMVGFYGVSGLPQVDDHRFIVETLRLVQ